MSPWFSTNARRGRANATSARVPSSAAERWARSFLAAARDSGFLAAGHHVFAIVQGSTFDDLRREAAQSLAALDFPGYAIGGVSVGEPEPEMLRQVAATAPFLPADKPRYTMGLGTPPQLLKMIALGVDMFDCVLPTRVARNGLAFTPDGPMNLRNEQYRADPRPVVEGLDNYTCRTFSRAYLRHLTVANEMLAGTLLTIHNLHFYLDLMAQARAHLEAGDFGRGIARGSGATRRARTDRRRRSERRWRPAAPQPRAKAGAGPSIGSVAERKAAGWKANATPSWKKGSHGNACRQGFKPDSPTRDLSL